MSLETIQIPQLYIYIYIYISFYLLAALKYLSNKLQGTQHKKNTYLLQGIVMHHLNF